jgi:restriction endonuclease S subunit
MVLKDIAKINIGVVVSRLPKNEPNGEGCRYNYFTLSSVEHDQTVEKAKLKELTTIGDIDEKFLSKKGDIIIGLSAPHSLAYIDYESLGIIIPSQFALIRVTDHEVLPEYLIAYLASDEVRREIDGMAKGTAVITIDIRKLANLSIYLPFLKKQRQIARLHAMIKEENQLNYRYAKLVEKKNTYYLNQLIEDKGALK